MRHILLALALIIVSSCSKSDEVNNCRYLLDLGVHTTINLNLPQYSQLEFTSNSVYIANQGNSGILVINVGNGRLRAWDASDPNHTPNTCSRLTINGANGVCGCVDANEYSLFTGQSIGQQLACTLKEYRVEAIGNNSYLISN